MKIERVSVISSADFRRDFLIPERPVIMTGMLPERFSPNFWNPENLLNEFGADILPVEVIQEDRAHDNAYRSAKLEMIKMPLREYLEKCQGNGSRYYMGQVPINQMSAKFQKAIGDVSFLPQVPFSTPWTNIWMGPPGNGSGLHTDNYSNFNAQILGHKKWTVFPRSQSKKLGIPNKELQHFSPIMLDNPDLESFPEFKETTPIEVVTNPGEILFIPRRWPHQAKALDFTINLNSFIRYRAHDLINDSRVLVRDPIRLLQGA